MNALSALLLLGIFLGSSVMAQVVPATPTHFTQRDMGTGFSASGASFSNSGAAPAKPAATTVRTTTYVVLSSARQWTSSDGRPLLAKLIAFEDATTVTTQAKDGSPTTAGNGPKPLVGFTPTVIKEGNVRLLVDQKPFALPLNKLSAADQDFIAHVKRVVEAAH